MSAESVNSEESLQSAITQDKLGEVGRLGMKMIRLQSDIDVLEETLKARNKELRDVSETLIPDCLLECGITSFELASGEKLILQTYYSAKIPEGGEQVAFNWLEKNEEDAIIKSQVSLDFGKGDAERAAEVRIVTFLENNNYIFNQKRGVHASTLKAFVKNKIESGEDLPQEMFGVYIGQRTKIKR